MNKSARDLGLNVVDDVVCLGGNVLILNKLSLVLPVVDSVIAVGLSLDSWCPSPWIWAHGSKLDCNLSSLSLMLTTGLGGRDVVVGFSVEVVVDNGTEVGMKMKALLVVEGIGLSVVTAGVVVFLEVTLGWTVGTNGII